jgi:GNAT superfamily N-acetyltransferase
MVNSYFEAMPLKVIEYGTPEYQQMVALRANILRAPLGLTFQPTELDSERSNILIGAFEDEDLLGCCMLLEEEPGIIRLRQMAVLESLQGKGVGKAIMNFAENVARDRGYKKITMHARKNAIGFYEKMGYEVKGDEFSEVTIPHYLMEKSLKQ